MKDSDILALALGTDDDGYDGNAYGNDDGNEANMIAVKSKIWFKRPFEKKNKVGIYNEDNSNTTNTMNATTGTTSKTNTNTTSNTTTNTTIKSRHYNITINDPIPNKKKTKKKHRRPLHHCYKTLSLNIRNATSKFCLIIYDSNRLHTSYNEIPLLWPVIDWIRGIRLLLLLLLPLLLLLLLLPLLLLLLLLLLLIPIPLLILPLLQLLLFLPLLPLLLLLLLLLPLLLIILFQVITI